MSEIVYISNVECDNCTTQINSITFDNFYNEIETNDTKIYIIDVHFSYNNTKLQDQSGVDIYRKLLKKFEGKQDLLKVVFYSPLSQDFLIKLKPENYVLKLLPFIECNYDGKFEQKLNDIIEEDKFPLFNNASENLLSGWALFNAENIKNGHKLERIGIEKKQIFFLDDQQLEWQNVFKEIFKNDKVSFLNECNKINDKKIKQDQNSIRNKINNEKVDFYKTLLDNLKNNIDNYSLILSDLYFTENHETEVFKESKDIEKISGFQIYNKIREVFPHIPYIFHTSSNKANIYKYFDSRGVDEWIVKDIRVNATHKQDHFEYFKNQIDFYEENQTIQFLKTFWSKIQELKDNENYKKKWWFNCTSLLNKDEKKAKEIIQILTDTWFVFRQQVNKELHFEESNKNNNWNSESFIAAAIINTLSQIKEILKLQDTYKEGEGKKSTTFAFFYGQLTHTITKIRNSAAHSKNESLYSFTLKDAEIFTYLIIDLLCLNEEEITEKYKTNKIKYIRVSKNDFLKVKKDNNDECFSYELFWIYAQIYCIHIDCKNEIKYDVDSFRNRIKEMYRKIKNEDEFYRLLKKYYLGSCNKCYIAYEFKNNWNYLKKDIECGSTT